MNKHIAPPLGYIPWATLVARLTPKKNALNTDIIRILGGVLVSLL